MNNKVAQQTKIKYHSAAVFVQNIEISKKFYTEVLELVIEFDFGKNVILEGGITLWEINPNHILPQQLGIGSINDRSINRFEFYFETEDIETVFENVKSSRVDLLHSLHEEPWGQRTFRFFDPDRHLIEIGESMETFVKRLYSQGITTEQISRKTSIPCKKVEEILGA